MSSEAVDNYIQVLGIATNCCKIQAVSNEAVDNYASTIQFVCEYYKTQKMCDE